MSDIREISNPSDKVTIDYADIDAARLAVIALGMGQYGIEGDNGLPILAFYGAERWVMATYKMGFEKWMQTIPADRLAAALETVANVGERTSINDIVGKAHEMAAVIRKRSNA